jgi:hypothetical protein
MEKVNIKFTLEPEWFNNAPKIKVAINDQTLLDVELGTRLEYEQTVELNDEGNHQLTFTLHNKTKYDTVVKDGVIEKDTLIKITNIELEDIDLTSMLSLNKELFYYEHDNNGTTQLEKHTLYDTLGCNGTATINFTTPFYIWLLENL